MATFYLFNNSQAQQTLGAGEVGFIAEGATLALQDDAIVVNGNADLSILGTVFSGDDNGINQQSAQFRLTIGASGQLVSQSLYGLYSRFTSLLTIDNAGYVSGYYYGLYGRVTDDFGNAYVTNTGTISSVVGSAVRLQPGTASAYISNSGTIMGYSGIQIVGSSSQITNSGTIIAVDEPTGLGWAISGGTARDAITNTGTIVGQISTNDGNDIVKNSGNVGSLDLGTGDDTYNGRHGIATGSVLGGTGNDVLIGGVGEDDLHGGADDDTLKGKNDDDTLAGDDGNDLLNGGAGDDTLLGGAGADTLRGGAGDDTLDGGAGDDTLHGGRGEDTLTGGTGDDTYIVNDTEDDIIETSGGGYDTVMTRLATFALTYDNVERLFGTSDAGQTLTGNALDNVIVGAGGNDTLFGAAGNDQLNGGAGIDIMDGGAGDDVYFVDNAGDVVIETVGNGYDFVATGLATFALTYDNVEALQGLSNTGQTLSGNSLDNAIYGNSGNDKLYGGFGNDYLDGGTGADTMNGGFGDDTYIADEVGDVVTEAVGAGIDTVWTALSSYSLGTVANVENLTGISAGGQVLAGNTLNNTVTGNAGNDALYGGLGDDTLRGNSGNDTMNGGGGSDTFIFAASFGHDTINGFHAGTTGDADVISIASGLIADFADLLSHTADVGANTVITVDASNTITLLGVHKADLDVSDFSFF
ncbi:calcium-binding protein [Pseudodonghicola flavimaris]|uniref:Calcium-binding protein n=1 Tax=Pseudodonghicola flavimaris TaxID=3050036 RepID=A0ABT7EVU4_9RHOB|nr:calcium-binding protein [Pseudodonghicola flavimaris]MDK3016464.1 calcium-binding protein [Pseudodonghicola flavimaris]